MTGLEAFIACTEGKRVRRIKWETAIYCIAVACSNHHRMRTALDKISFYFVLTHDNEDLDSCFDKETGRLREICQVNAGCFMHDDWEVVD